MSSPGKLIDSLKISGAVSVKRLFDFSVACQCGHEEPVITSRNILRPQSLHPSPRTHGPKPNAGANGLVAFGAKEVKELRRDAFSVRCARHHKDGNVQQTTVSRMISDCEDAEALNVAFRVARNDDLLSLVLYLAFGAR